MTPKRRTLGVVAGILKSKGVSCEDMLGAWSARERIWVLLHVAIATIADITGRSHSQASHAVWMRLHTLLRSEKIGKSTAKMTEEGELLEKLLEQTLPQMLCPYCHRSLYPSQLETKADG